MTVAIIFPGQGTQQPGMGAPWRDHAAWSVIEEAEAAFGEPLASLVLDAPPELLARTREAQLAVLLTSLMAWTAIRDSIDAPVAFAGHSLGQVTALIASGALPLAAGVQFAARRAELTQAAADAHPGRMAALLGATLEQAEEACSAAPDVCWIANDNVPGQVVIAGTPDGVDAGSVRAKELGVKRVTPLNVGGAFHTPLMRDAADALPAELEHVKFAIPVAPVVSNHDARAYDDGDGWRSRLPDHVAVPVRWRSSMETIATLGATTWLEVGHGTMLAGLAKRTVPDITVLGIATPDDVAPSRGGPLTMEAMLDHGEGLLVPERMIVAPTVGTFRPVDVPDGTNVHRGQTVGMLEGPGTSTPVSSPFAGRLVGMLVHPGERIREGQPIAWLRVH